MRLTFTRFVLAGILASLVCAPKATAQTDYSYRSATNFFTIGAGFLGGASMATEVPPTGSKIGPVFAWKLGLNLMYPISSVASVTLDLGLDTRGTKIRVENNADIYDVQSFQYFAITPGIRLSSFWMGLNLGLPMGGSHTTKSGLGSGEITTDFTQNEKDFTATMIEGRIGVSVPVIDQKTWWLGLNFSVGYCFSNLWTYTETLMPYNPPLASAHLGFTAQYAIPKTGRR